jgi:hypothetical protein
MPESPLAPALLALSERPIYYPSAEFLRIQSGLDTQSLKMRAAIQGALFASSTIGAMWHIACSHDIDVIVGLSKTDLLPAIAASAPVHEGPYFLYVNPGGCAAEY